MIGKPVIFALFVAACGTDVASTSKLSYEFGPFSLGPGEEDTDLCVAATLHNTEPLFVNRVDMIGAAGIHHSNWMWVPAANVTFGGFPEGTFRCSEGDGRGHAFDQQAAAFYGGVLFAQSTQAASESQEFPPGAAIRIPPDARIVADVHLLNSSDSAIEVPLSLSIEPIPERQVSTLLNAFAMENLGIALPPMQRSRFTVECDLSQNAGHVPANFGFYHALAHYHKWGTGLTLQAVRDDGSGVDTIWSTETGIGGELGGMLAPAFDMTGHSKVRLTCDFNNTEDHVIRWGNGDGEMCISFAYIDSPYVWTAGLVTTSDNPGPGVTGADGVTSFTAPACTGIIAKEAN